MNRTRTLLTGLTVLFGLLITSSAGAYIQQTFRNDFGVETKIHWTAESFPIHFVLNDQGSLDIGDTSDFTALRNAYGTWGSLSTSVVSFVDDGLTASTFLGNDGFNNNVFVDGDPDVAGTSIIGLASVTFSPVDGHILDADIRYNEDFTFNTSGTPGADIDLQAVAVHETGHLLGLDHTFISNATMFPFYNLSQRTPKPDDIAGISTMYPDPSFFASTGRIKGSVRTLITDKPLLGVNVIALDALGQQPVVNAVTDENGNYTIPGLPADSYFVRVEPVSPQNLGGIFDEAFVDFDPLYYDQVATLPEASTVTVAAGGQRAGVDFLLPDRLKLRRDDGQVESYIFLTQPAAGNEYFAVRFDEILLPETFLLDAATFVNGNDPVTGYELMVTPDIAGEPDINNAFVTISGLNALALEEVNATLGQIEVNPRQDLWVVVRYPAGQNAALGVDTDGIDSIPPTGLLATGLLSAGGVNWQAVELGASPVNLSFTLTIIPVTPPPMPQVDSVSDNKLSQGESATIQLLGDHFLDGATVTINGTGVTIDGVSFVATTQLDLDLSVALDAPTGLRDMTITNPDNTSVLARSIITVLPQVSLSEILTVRATPALAASDSVLVTIELENAIDVAGFSFDIDYDPLVMSPKIITGSQAVANSVSRTSGFELLAASEVSAGRVRCTGIADLLDPGTAAALSPGSGPVVKLAFSVAAGLPLASHPITISDANLSDDTGATLVLPTLVDGTLVVSEWILGDLNLDSLPYTIADVLTSVAALLGDTILAGFQLPASDVNDDGVQNNVADAVFIVNVLLELESPLGRVADAASPVRAWLEGEGSRRVLMLDSPVELGGALFELGLEPGSEIERVQSASAFPFQIRQDADGLRLLALNLSGERLPAGRNAVATIELAAGSIQLKAVDAAGADGQSRPALIEATTALPRRLALSEAIPNPFNPRTTLEASLPAPCQMRLSLVDVRGRQVRVLADGEMEAGNWKFTWEGRDDRGREVASGVYYAILEACGEIQTRKLALIR